jgi:hypothetical protein
MPGIEGRPVVDEPRQHGVGVAKVGARLLHHTARLESSVTEPAPFPAGMPVSIVMLGSDN